MRKKAAIPLIVAASLIIASGIAIVAWVRAYGDRDIESVVIGDRQELQERESRSIPIERALVGDSHATSLKGEEAARVRKQSRERHRERINELIRRGWQEQEGPIDGGDPDRIPDRDYLVGTWTYRFPDSLDPVGESEATFGPDGSFRRGQHGAGHCGTWSIDGRRINISIESASGYYYTGPQEWTEQLTVGSVSKSQMLLKRDGIGRSFIYQRHDAAAANPRMEADAATPSEGDTSETE
jgi:hypothetical protein